MKMLALLLAFACMSTRAQSPAVSTDVSLKINPHISSAGGLQSFTFTLTNATHHPVVLPEPILDCGGSYTGAIWLRYRVVTPDQAGSGMGWGCAADKYGWPTITDRVKGWKTLHPGESLRLEGEAQTLHLKSLQAGTYDFWADYTPPSVTSDEARTLMQSGYQLSLKELTSEHVHLEVGR